MINYRFILRLIEHLLDSTIVQFRFRTYILTALFLLLILEDILVKVLKRLPYVVLNVFWVCLAYACELCEVGLRWLMNIVVSFLFFGNLRLHNLELKQFRLSFGNNLIPLSGFHLLIIRFQISNWWRSIRCFTNKFGFLNFSIGLLQRSVLWLKFFNQILKLCNSLIVLITLLISNIFELIKLILQSFSSISEFCFQLFVLELNASESFCEILYHWCLLVYLIL